MSNRRTSPKRVVHANRCFAVLFCVMAAPGFVFADSWELENPVPTGSDAPRILVYHDMEGLAGQTDPRTYNFRHPEYKQGQVMLAADLNAVIAGLFDGGAGTVHVVDGHGSGNPDPDVRTDLLDPRASQVFRDEPFDAYMELAAPGTYDAVAVVGMHAKTGSGGFASHTFTLGMAIHLNGRSITETELIALSWGRVGTPVIFASGDDRLALDLRDRMPWIEMVTVKTATGNASARARPVHEARAEMTAAARRAVKRLDNARVMRLNRPVTAALQAVPPASLANMNGVPGIHYANGTVTFLADDMAEAYDGILALIGVASGGYYAHALAGMASDGGPPVMDRFRAIVSQTWDDQESLPHQPQDSDQASGAGGSETPARKRWHGYQ